jgi:hypothetical protein
MPVLVKRNDHRRATRRLIDDRCGAEIPITLRVLTGWVNRLKTAKQVEVHIEGNHAVRIRRVALRHTICGSRCCINPAGTYAAPAVASGGLYVGSRNGFNTGEGGTIRAFALGSSGCSPPPRRPCFWEAKLFSLHSTTRCWARQRHFKRLLRFVERSVPCQSTSMPHQCDHPGSRPIRRFRWSSGRLDLARMNSQLIAGARNDIPISGAIVTSGATSWIAILDTHSGTLRFRDGSGCTSEMSQQTNLARLPATWVSGPAYPSCSISAYGRTAP